MKIKTNLGSIVAQKNLKEHSKSLESSTAKLSSGKRITKASDDAAGLAISSRLEALQKSKRQAIRNGNDAISVVQVAEGSLNELTNMVTRIRELAVQAASDTNSDPQRGNLNEEAQALLREIDRIAESTEYNGQKLFTPREENEKFSIFVSDESRPEAYIHVEWDDMNQSAYALGLSKLDISSQVHAKVALLQADQAIESINKSRAKLGAYQARFETAVSNLENSYQQQAKALSFIQDMDVAQVTASRTQNQMLLDSASSVLSQANIQPNNLLKLIK